MSILSLPVAWQEYIIGLERAADVQRQHYNTALAFCAILVAVVVFLLYKGSAGSAAPRQPYRWAPERKPESATMLQNLERIALTNRQAFLGIANHLFAKKQIEVFDDLSRGVCVLDDVIFASGVALARGVEFSKLEPKQMRQTIIDDVRAGNGIALRTDKTTEPGAPAETSVTFMQANEIDQFLSTRRIA